MLAMLVEKFVRIERSHASGTGGSDGLTIHVIRDIAGGEYAGYARRGRATFAATANAYVTVASQVSHALAGHASVYPADLDGNSSPP